MLNTLLHSLRFSILNIEFCRLDSSWNYKDVISPFTRIYLITGGEGYLNHHTTQFHLKKNCLCLIPRFSHSSYECPQYLEQYYIHVSHEMDQGMDIFNLLRFNYMEKAEENDFYLFKRLLNLNPGKELKVKDPKIYDNKPGLFDNQKPKEISHCKNFTESMGILLQLFSRFMTNDSTRMCKNLTTNTRIREAFHYINSHLDKKITIKQLADRVCLNPDHFSRLFLRLIGMRPLEYINKQRIEKAQSIILTSDRSFDEIAFSLGFENYNYFSRLFSKYLHITPTEYKKKYRLMVY